MDLASGRLDECKMLGQAARPGIVLVIVPITATKDDIDEGISPGLDAATLRLTPGGQYSTQRPRSASVSEETLIIGATLYDSQDEVGPGR